MTKQLTVGPSEEELTKRINEHLALHSGSECVIMIWRGYLAGLVEFGIITPKTYSNVSQILPESVGLCELNELMGGLPSEDEDHPANKISTNN